MTAYLAELQARLAGQPTAAIPSSGRNIPFGAAVLSNGINFSVFSRHASRVELLLFDDAEERRPTRANDPRNSCRPTLRLSRYWAIRTRARPRFRSEQGSARPIWACCCRARRIFSPDGKRIRGNDAIAMKSVVIDPSSYDWEGDGPLRRPIASTVIYGTHVAGFTRHPSSSVASELRGTYSAGARGPIPHPATLRRCAGFANRRRSRSRERPRGNKRHNSH